MELLAKPVTKVWLALVVITVISTWVLTEDGIPATVAVPAIMILAAGKVALVMARFMELRDAPRPFQVAFGAWVVVVPCLVLGFYFLAGR